jgi:uncharacterized Zn-finger protein
MDREWEEAQVQTIYKIKRVSFMKPFLLCVILPSLEFPAIMGLSPSFQIRAEKSLQCRCSPCKIPNHVFKHLSDRNRHEQQQHGPKTPCPRTECSREFKRPGTLKRHLIEHDQADEFGKVLDCDSIGLK